MLVKRKFGKILKPILNLNLKKNILLWKNMT